MLQKASNAKEESENDSINEKVRLAKLEYKLEMRSNPNANQLDTMTNALRKVLNDDTMEVKQSGNGFTFTSNGKKIQNKIRWYTIRIIGRILIC